MDRKWEANKSYVIKKFVYDTKLHLSLVMFTVAQKSVQHSSVAGQNAGMT